MENSANENNKRAIFEHPFLWQLNMMQNYMLEQPLLGQDQDVQSEPFFRPWESISSNQQANIAVVRPFQLNQNVFTSRFTSPRENLHKKLLRGNHIQYQHRYQQQQQQNHVNSPNINHDPESVILNRPLFLETTNEPTRYDATKLNDAPKNLLNALLSPPKTSSSRLQQNYQSMHHDLNQESDNSNDLIICEDENKQEQSDDTDDVDEIESASSEGSNSLQPLDLRTTKIPYSSTAHYEISVIRSLSPVPVKLTTPRDPSKEKSHKKLKTKRRICTACDRTYLKTKNLRWHFKSKLHYKRVKKLGIDDPANQPDTWYKVGDQHDNFGTKTVENNKTQDE